MSSLNLLAQIADLNPIERFSGMFSAGLSMIYDHPIKVNMHRTCDAIGVQTCHELLLSNPHQIRAVIMARGGYTSNQDLKYCLLILMDM